MVKPIPLQSASSDAVMRTRAEALKLGFNRYFTGQPCNKGHVSLRIAKSAKCVECRRLSEYERRNRPERYALERKQKKEYRDALRCEVIAALGDKCACPGCDVTTYKFLTIDHVNGGGRQHRKTVGGATTFYLHIKKEGYPKGKYRILCHNCNHCYGHYGSCPHNEKSK